MITALAGGTGAAKFLRGLSAVVPPPQVTVIGNVGDDTTIWGLHISPDLDTVTYAFAALLDEARGWGLSGDTFNCLAAMAALGEETWFNLGDRDLAIHLFRTECLRAGQPLSAVTEAIRSALAVRSRILPASDSPVATRVLTAGGWLGFQEFFVREKAQVEVLDVAYVGAEQAAPAPGVLDAVASATGIVVCPSNPVTSIGPILAIPGIAEALTATPARVIAISPIVGGAAVSGPAGRLMAAKGLPVSPVGVAELYRPWLDFLVLDRRDEAWAPEVAALGITPVIAETIMTDRRAAEALARAVVEALP